MAPHVLDASVERALDAIERDVNRDERSTVVGPSRPAGQHSARGGIHVSAVPFRPLCGEACREA